MTPRRSAHESQRIDVDTASDAPPWVTADVRVFYPPDTAPGLVAELLRDVCRRVLAQLDNPSAQRAVTVELPETVDE